MGRDRLVPLDEAEETEGWPLSECNWCDDKDQDRPKAVLAVEHDGRVHRFMGICGHHAEVMGLEFNAWTAITP